MSADMIENAISNALEWIRPNRPDNRHFAAVYVLHQLAIDSPTHFYVHVGEFFATMWSVLCSTTQEIREKAAKVLKECLQMAAQRKVEQCQEWYRGVYTTALDHLEKHSQSEGVHGALLAIEQLVRVPHARDEFVSKHLEELVNGRRGGERGVFSVKGHKDRSVRQQFLRLLPALHASPRVSADTAQTTGISTEPPLARLPRGCVGEQLAEVTQFDGTVRYLIELLRKGEERYDPPPTPPHSARQSALRSPRGVPHTLPLLQGRCLPCAGRNRRDPG
jgi:hypothetical protein